MHKFVTWALSLFYMVSQITNTSINALKKSIYRWQSTFAHLFLTDHLVYQCVLLQNIFLVIQRKQKMSWISFTVIATPRSGSTTRGCGPSRSHGTTARSNEVGAGTGRDPATVSPDGSPQSDPGFSKGGICIRGFDGSDPVLD